MMRNNLQNKVTAHKPYTDEDSWDALYERIRLLALRRSKALLNECGDEPEIFDRGARSLRTLMSAAQVARQMKSDEAKEQDPHEAAQDPVISDHAIRRVKRQLDREIARIDSEDRPDQAGIDAAVLSGIAGEGLGGERS